MGLIDNIYKKKLAHSLMLLLIYFELLIDCVTFNKKNCFSNDIWVLVMLQKNAKVVSIDGYEDVPSYNENALKKAVAHQPVSVAIEASGRALQLYQSVIPYSYSRIPIY